MTPDGPTTPTTAWTTVCFRSAGAGGDGVDGRWSLVVRCSGTGREPVLVRSGPVSSSPCTHPPGPLPCDLHLRVDADSPERTGLMAYADVLVSRVPLPPGPAGRRVRELLADHPGCLAAAVPDTATRCVVGVRTGTGGVSLVRPLRYGPPSLVPRLVPRLVPPHVVASLVHAWVVAGRAPGELCSLAPAPTPLAG